LIISLFWCFLLGQRERLINPRDYSYCMVFGLFGHKRRVEDLRHDVQSSFNHVKKDFNKVGEWIKHLDDKHGTHDGEITSIKDQLMSIHEDLMEIKDFVAFFGPQAPGKVSKQPQTGVVKQTNNERVQTGVQTGVQTEILFDLTVMERAIVWSLLNSEMKLSYEDLSALLGKDKSTIRGQINAIKQKKKGLIEEVRESNGKKRLFIPEEIRENIIKNVKVRIKGQKQTKK